MTWTQFKTKVEAQLKEKGISEDRDIWYIDISSSDRVYVDVYDSSGIAISD